MKSKATTIRFTKEQLELISKLMQKAYLKNRTQYLVSLIVAEAKRQGLLS